MDTLIGAAWASGELPPWMQQRPGFDECAAADAADDLAAAQLAERFGPIVGLDAERIGRPLVALVAEDPTDHPGTFAHRRAVLDRALRRGALVAHRRAVLEAALHPTDHPAAADSRRAA